MLKLDSRVGVPLLAALLAGVALAQQPLEEAAELEAARARKAELELELGSCSQGCEALRSLAADLGAYVEELEAAEQAASALDQLRIEAQKERSASESEPSELSPDEAQRLTPAQIEELEQNVRVTGGRRVALQEEVDQARSKLDPLRRRQEKLASLLASIREGKGRDAAPVEERRGVIRKRRDLAGERIRKAMESLDLARDRLASVEELLGRRSARLSSVRLAEGIPAEELERTRVRVEQLRFEVAQRALTREAQQRQIDQNLEGARQRLAEAETEDSGLEQLDPREEGQALVDWTRRKAVAEDAVAAARSQIDALEAASDLVQESSHLDGFLLSIQSTELEHDQDFNRLVSLIRERTSDAAAIEEGLARLQDRVVALSAEMQALEVAAEKLRGEIKRASERTRHTALRLQAAIEEAEAAGDADPLLNRRLELLEAHLNHQQAVSEGLSSRRSLIEEALEAAGHQLKKYKDSVHLLESYVSGALRFNLGTLSRSVDWLGDAASELGRRLRQLPDDWLEARLSLRQPHKRDRAVEIATQLGFGVLGLGLVDWLVARRLRRRRQALGVRARPVWLMTSVSEQSLAAPSAERAAAEPFLLSAAVEPERGGLLRRMLVFVLSSLQRPVELAGLCLFGAAVVPEARGAFAAVLVLACVWLTRRLGAVAATSLLSRDPELPSLRLAPRHAPFLLRWSFWLLLIWPPVMAAYVAAVGFGAPVHVQLSLGLLSLVTTLGFALLLLIRGRDSVVSLIQVRSAREKPSLPVLLYNRLLAQTYLIALLAVLAIVGLYGAGYAEWARWLGTSSLLSAAIVALVALLVRALHLWMRRAIDGSLVWGEMGSVLLHLAEGGLVIGAVASILVVWGVDLAMLVRGIRDQLERELFKTADGRSIRLLSLGWVIVLLVATIWLSRRVRDLLQRRVFPYLSIDRGQQLSLSLVLHYGMLLLAGLIGLNLLGINLTTLSVVFGAIGLGVGFGLQTIVNNFVSGIILLFERSIRPDDVIDFGGSRVKVEEVRARCTIVTDRDNKRWIVPNVRFMNETITNWTHNDLSVRGQIHFYVSAATDLERLREVVEGWARSYPEILPSPSMHLRLVEIQRGYFHLALYYFTDQNWRFGWHRSRVSYALVELLRREGFELPAPETIVHLAGIEAPGALAPETLPAASREATVPSEPGRRATPSPEPLW
jgi:small-conductance mechanosensitive channel